MTPGSHVKRASHLSNNIMWINGLLCFELPQRDEVISYVFLRLSKDDGMSHFESPQASVQKKDIEQACTERSRSIKMTDPHYQDKRLREPQPPNLAHYSYRKLIQNESYKKLSRA